MQLFTVEEELDYDVKARCQGDQERANDDGQNLVTCTLTMIVKVHVDKDRGRSIAIFSDCKSYRFVLERTWDYDGLGLLFIMLNPSTADEIKTDPTIERCERRAKALGFGSLRVCNIFAYRATDPMVMKSVEDPIGGEENDSWIRACSTWSDVIICAWGCHGSHRGRGEQVESMLRESVEAAFHLGINKGGAPKHPLYVGYDTEPEQWF
jgi:hypothetical protein